MSSAHTSLASDHYWALLRLVLFDNVSAFVDCASQSRSGSEKPERMSSGVAARLVHPAFGKVYHQTKDYTACVDWYGMRLPTSVSEYVHELSWRLETPEWWATYKSELGEFFRHRPHPPARANDAYKNGGNYNPGNPFQTPALGAMPPGTQVSPGGHLTPL